MDIQGLKDKILELAIQGKLVEQDSNDEPASVLLERIKEEKDRLVEEKKIKKTKPLSAITEEEKPFDIPESWEWVRLETINTNSLTGLVKAKKDQSREFKYPYFKMNNIDNNGTCNFKNITNVNASDKEVYLYSVKNGDFLFNTRNSKELVGKSCVIINMPYEKMLFNNNILKISFNNNYINTKFINYWFNTSYAKRILNNYKGSTTNVCAIYQRDLFKLLIPIPPFLEQKRIVDKINELFSLLDKLSSNKEDLLTTIELTRNQVLQEAIKGKLVEQNSEDEPASVLLEKIKREKELLIEQKKFKKTKPLAEITEEEKPFDIPESWEWVRLGTIGHTQTGTTPSTKNIEYFNGNIPFIKPSDISEKGINYNNESLTELGLTKGRLIEKNSVLMVCIGGSIGKNSYTDRDVACNQQINTFTPYENVCNMIIYYFMNSLTFYNSILKSKTGTATPIINKSKWDLLLVPLPPLEEQKRIVLKIDNIMRILDEFENQLIIQSKN